MRTGVACALQKKADVLQVFWRKLKGGWHREKKLCQPIFEQLEESAVELHK